MASTNHSKLSNVWPATQRVRVVKDLEIIHVSNALLDISKAMSKSVKRATKVVLNVKVPPLNNALNVL